MKDYFAEVDKSFNSQLNQIKSFITHPGTKGLWAERLLSNFLRDYVPTHFAVSSGFVYVDKNTVSPQIDILIHEASRYAPLFQFGDIVVVRPESAIYAIEVKTKLNKKEFFSTLDSMKTIKEMVGNTSSSPPANLCKCDLFCFGSVLEKTVQKYIRQCPPEKNGYALDGIHCIGNKQFSIIFGIESGSSSRLLRKSPEHIYYSLKKADRSQYDIAFLVFYATLIDYLEIILGHSDQSFKDRLRSEGKRGMLIEYLRSLAIEIDYSNPIILGVEK